MRRIQYSYSDPLDLIWLHAARQLGMTVRRASEVFAAWNGKGELTIGSAETLDADDSLAQMIFHEMCHAITEGPDAWNLPDWGLDITDPAQRVREFACLRLQAALSDRFGLRQFLASTTTFRRYYDSLKADPLQDHEDPAASIARDAFERSRTEPWLKVLDEALHRTAQVAAVILPVAADESLWSTAQSSQEAVSDARPQPA